MGYRLILFERDGSVATITMNRPEAMNTIGSMWVDELGDAAAICAGLEAFLAKQSPRFTGR